MTVVATQSAERSVPVVDIETLADVRTLATIDRACREWGFFQVVNHAIPSTVCERLFDAARRFFAQPAGKKHDILRTAENPWGYYDQELTKNERDRKEVFDFGLADGDRQVPQWPAGLPGFEPAVRHYYDACETLAFRLLAAISANLGMAPHYLAKDFRRSHTSFMRLNYYPRLNGSEGLTGRGLGVGPHSDAGALTILLQDEQPGLEVCREDCWYLVEPVPGALVINLGDIAQVWSNDRYRAALHRVLTNADRDRYSAPYFFNPAWETDYAPLPTTVDAAHPPRYRPINWREFRTLRHAGDYADYGAEVQISDYRLSAP